MDKAAKVAAGGALVTFGITPTAPETGYGYIKRGAAIAGIEGCHEVAQFLEKPALAKAESMLQAGGFDWNSGMFMFRADRLLAEMRRLAPEVVLACERATAAARRDLSFIRLDAAAFGDSPSISIDYAVMEKTGRAAVVSADIGWSNVGSWSALWEHGQNQGDEKNNVTAGDVLLDDVSSSYIRAERRMVAAVGVEDPIIVETGDAVLVAGQDKAQGVKRIVDRLRAEGRDEASQNPRVYRPWAITRAWTTATAFKLSESASSRCKSCPCKCTITGPSTGSWWRARPRSPATMKPFCWKKPVNLYPHRRLASPGKPR